MAVMCAGQGEALSFHRSFRSREVGITAGIGMRVPVDARVDKAIEQGRAKEAERVKVMIGRVTSVIDGRTFRLVTGGGTVIPVRLEGIEVSSDDTELNRELWIRLKRLILGKTVRAEYRVKDEDGFASAQVTLNRQSVNALLEKQ